jgi:membrane-bound metal-dependent hydrolase YbcI (DUF457 family)
LRAQIARAIDYRLVAFGTLLPDLVDKPIGKILFRDLFDDNGHVVGHTLLFALVLLLPGAWLAVNRRDVRLLCVGLGNLSHLAVDPVTHSPATLLWPLLGTDFPQITLLGPTAGLAAEAAAGLVLLSAALLLYRGGRMPAFLRTGRL